MALPNPYESERLVSEYLLFHYGGPTAVFGTLPGPRDAVGFAKRLVDVLIDPERRTSKGTPKALDIGCAVGGSSFELAARGFDVIGIDYSSAFIRTAKALQKQGELMTEIAVEAARKSVFRAVIPDSIPRERVQFEVGDAMALRDNLGRFDVVVAANLICRLPEPQRFLDRLPELLNPGGQLLLTTPFTWMEEYTPESQWIGGPDDLTGRDCFEALQARLSPYFQLDFQTDIPFVIREHARKFQYTVALGSRWIRL